MKNFVLILLCFFTFCSQAQWNFDLRAGGASVVGLSINAQKVFQWNEVHGLGLSAGVGVRLLPDYSGVVPTPIINLGLQYSYKNWGVGSGLALAPWIEGSDDTSTDGSEFNFYPNVNYSFRFNNASYLNISLGASIGFNHYSSSDRSFSEALSYVGYVYPGAGVSYGFSR